MNELNLDPTILKWIGQALLIILPSTLAYFLGRRKLNAESRKAEVDVMSGELDNISREMSIYKVMMSDLRNTLKKATFDYEKLEAQFIIIMQERDECLDEKCKLQEENIVFYRKIQTCEYNNCGLKQNKK